LRLLVAMLFGEGWGVLKEARLEGVVEGKAEERLRHYNSIEGGEGGEDDVGSWLLVGEKREGVVQPVMGWGEMVNNFDREERRAGGEDEAITSVRREGELLLTTEVSTAPELLSDYQSWCAVRP
jgi:hypothetical protein